MFFIPKTQSVSSLLTVSPRYSAYRPANDGRFTSQCLFNHVTKEQAGKGIVSCGKACRSDPRCRSFNLLEQEGGKMVCQLNNATRHEAAEGEMKEEGELLLFLICRNEQHEILHEALTLC